MSEPGRACLGPPPVHVGLTALVTMTYAPILMVFAFGALVAGALLFIPTLIAPRRRRRDRRG